VYGWRGRVGLILPVDNAVMEPELYSCGLDGVSFHGARLTTEVREEMPRQGIDVAPVFSTLGVDAIVYACAETSFLGGVDQNRAIIDEIEKGSGLPAVSATWAMVLALQHMQMTRVALLTPYTDERGAVMEDFLRRNGIAVTSSRHHVFEGPRGESRQWYATNLQSPDVAYRMCRELDLSDADGVLISATNFRTFEIIDALERDIGRPVIACNQAILWWALRQLRVNADLPRLGALLRQSDVR